MSAEQNKALARRFFDEVCNGRKLDVAAEILTANHVYHGPLSVGPNRVGPEAMAQEVAIYQHAFADARWVVEEVFAAGDDRVVVRWRGQGTHTGELQGIPPTGRTVDVQSIWVCRVEGGKIAESWEVWDALRLLQQLGVVPAPEAQPAEPPGGDGQAALDPAALARTVYAFFSNNQFDRVLELATDDVEIAFIPTGQFFRGKAGFLDFMKGFKTAFPDIQIEVINQVVTGTQVVSEFRVWGTHTGPLRTPDGEIPPTNRKAEWTVCEVWQVRDGKLAGLRNYQDSATLMRQLGLLPETA